MIRGVIIGALLALTAAAATTARAQTITPAPGCQTGVACQAGTMAIGGAVMGPDALAVTGTASVSGTIVSSVGSIRVTSNTGIFTLGTSNDVVLGRLAAASLVLGGSDAPAPVAQTLGVQRVATGTANTAGANFIIAGSPGTGTGAGGSLLFQVAPAGSPGSTQNGLSTALSIASTRDATFSAGVIGAFLQTNSGGTADPGSAGGTDFSKIGVPAYTSNDGTGAGANAFWNNNAFGVATLTATNARTYTNANGLYVAAPVCSTNVTCTGTNALYAAGNVISTATIMGSSLASINGVSVGTTVAWNSDTFLARAGVGNVRFGAADSAAPVAQTDSVQNVVTGTTNTAGANRTFAGSQGTGTGPGGSLLFQVASAGSTGSSPNALATALTIDSTKLATFAAGIATGGTITASTGGLTVPGNVTTTSGSVLAAAAGGFTFAGRSTITSPVDANLLLQNNSQTGFGLLQFGCGTSSCPAFKRNGTGVDLRLADDSGYANLVAGALFAGNQVQAGAGSFLGWAGKSQLYSSVDGNMQLSNQAGSVVATMTAGVSGAITFGGQITSGGNIQMPGSSVYQWSGRASVQSPADGVILATKSAGGQLTVSTLVACSSGSDGARAFVTDATTTTFAAAVIGSGANHVPVYCDGSGTPTWKIG